MRTILCPIFQEAQEAQAFVNCEYFYLTHEQLTKVICLHILDFY